MLTKRDFPDNSDEPFRPAVSSVRCPRCRSNDLVLIEIIEAYTEWIVQNGRLNRQAGYHEPGSPLRVNARCSNSKCGHVWKVTKAHQITDCAKELDPKTFELIE